MAVDKDGMVSVTPFLHELSDKALRDWFAGLAMQGVLAADRVRSVESSGEYCSGEAKVAGIAYGMADAMLKEREKE